MHCTTQHNPQPSMNGVYTSRRDLDGAAGAWNKKVKKQYTKDHIPLRQSKHKLMDNMKDVGVKIPQSEGKKKRGPNKKKKK
jgi:hypothetical protein